MQSLTLHTHIGADGILKIEVPVDFNDTDVEVVLVIERVKASVEQGISIHEPHGEYGIQVQLPSSLLQLGLSKSDIQQRVSEWAVLSLFTEGRISSGKAASILNISRLDFLSLLKTRGIAYVNYSSEELAAEIESAGCLTLREK